jgi:hypothetical protein
MFAHDEIRIYSNWDETNLIGIITKNKAYFGEKIAYFSFFSLFGVAHFLKHILNTKLPIL